MGRRASTVALLCSMALGACDGTPDAVTCSADAAAAPAGGPSCACLRVYTFVTDRAETELVVRGTVSTLAPDVTVRSVTVGPVTANADGFNFSSWSAAVDRDRLLALPRADGGPRPGADIDAGPDFGFPLVTLPVRYILGRGGVQDTCTQELVGAVRLVTPASP